MLKCIEEGIVDGRPYDAPASSTTSAEKCSRIVGVDGGVPARVNVPCFGKPMGKQDHNWYGVTRRIGSVRGAHECSEKRQT